MSSADENMPLEHWGGRAILLVDLDAFFASVEQLDHPAWRGKPVIVGGDADKHGVVSTCSYEAREFGVRSAMPASLARELCPEAIWTHGRFGRYREVSEAVMDILRDETPHVQQVSIDEAFMDVSPTKVNTTHPVTIAQRVQKRVSELGVTCSVGVGTTKSVAKIASDRDKPRGITVVYPGGEARFLEALPVRTLSGIGPAAEALLVKFGIRTLGDMAHADASILRKAFGKNAEMMRKRAAGADVSEVAADDGVKSVSHEVTFAEDLTSRADIEAAIDTLAAKVARRLRRKGLRGRTLSLRMRYDARTPRSAQTRLSRPSDDEFAMMPELHLLVDELWREGMHVRLIGVGVAGFTEVGDQEATEQGSLFDLDAVAVVGASEEGGAGTLDESTRRELIGATDALKDKFGEDAVRFGRELRNEGNTTGSSPKNPADYK